MLADSSHRRAAKKAQKTVRRTVSFTCTLLASIAFATAAHSQDTKDDLDLSTIQLPKASSSRDASGLSYNLPTGPSRALDDLTTLSTFGLDMPTIDLPIDAIGSTLFKLDVSDPDCLSGAGRCERRTDRLSLGLSEYITAKKDGGIDFVLRPRASFRFDDDSSSAIVGAVVEIGEDLRRGSDIKTNTWYLFAGADAEALTYSPDGMRQLSSGRFHLQDRIIVGDAQAGLGYRIGDADVSLSYLRREANAEGFSYNEDAAALSFTWKR
ncbi:hypothetical protein GCM10009069_11040 [Algimonas arctica]|uniref:Uncharacterized protein n=1 Tax=Algimonas arctica TaxID=1479486 RepID=A0A8J3CRT9_9PROT|nr:hypothetical protein GCM10009069_11040 [Algimonas arctica]